MRTLQEKHDVSKIKLVAQNLKDARIDVCGIQECRERGIGNFVEGDYEFHYSGYKKFPGGMAQSGVMIAIRISPMIEIKAIEHISHRLLSADLVIQGLKVKVIVAYAPTERGDSDKKKAETVNSITVETGRQWRKVLPKIRRNSVLNLNLIKQVSSNQLS